MGEHLLAGLNEHRRQHQADWCSFCSYALGVLDRHGHKAKLPIYRSVYAPTLTYGPELWVMGRLPQEDFQACPTRRRPRGRPRTR